MKKLMISGSQKAKIINLYLHNITPYSESLSPISSSSVRYKCSGSALLSSKFYFTLTTNPFDRIPI